MLTDSKLKSLKAKDKPYKVSDRDGLYVYVSTVGGVTFRYDYQINGRRETLSIGKYGASGIHLSEARQLLIQAKKLIAQGISPMAEKKREKLRLKNANTFGDFIQRYLSEADFAKSTLELRVATYKREMESDFGSKLMIEITPEDIRNHCEAIRDRGAPSTAVFVRDLFNATYKYAISKGAYLVNPAELVTNASIAKFKPRERSLSPREIHLFFNALNHTEKYLTLRKAVLLVLYTMVRKSELVYATWDEIDFKNNVWTIPAERMKARRAHNVYLSHQVVEIFTAFKVFCEDSRYLLPSRTSKVKPISLSSLNRVVNDTVAEMNKEGIAIDSFTIHDLRRTGSTLLNEYGFNTDWIEKSLAHEQQGTRAVYNKAEYAAQRREMMQQWADMVDRWISGEGL
ncbi:tyrosine-type recombinase/integrase [Pelistega ratti]|uniref:tyrosine-type recombinase/integrase n=1 Tax=Pelistega ratti TaxID=2652177 RepID=UPI00135B9CCD|nr:site-specific integrase [Pelistega ratti]